MKKLKILSWLTAAMLCVCVALWGDDDDSLLPSESYIIKPSDVIKLSVFGEDDMQSEIRVDADGHATFPLIGEVAVGGKTISEARREVTKLYDRDYLVNPQVQLLITFFAEWRVQVLGQVNKPGFVSIPPDEELTLLQAIASAGGFTRLADQKTLRLKRFGSDGKAEVYKINAKEILLNPDVKDWVLQRGDSISVAETRF